MSSKCTFNIPLPPIPPIPLPSFSLPSFDIDLGFTINVDLSCPLD